jgi:hypothetical protein
MAGTGSHTMCYPKSHLSPNPGLTITILTLVHHRLARPQSPNSYIHLAHLTVLDLPLSDRILGHGVAHALHGNGAAPGKFIYVLGCCPSGVCS